MEQRLEFVLRWSKHETSMAELCRAFGISRKTGYELVMHFQAEGLDGLKRHSRAPRHHPNAIAEDVWYWRDGEGDWDQALTHWQRSLRLYEEIGDQRGLAITLRNLGEAH